MERGGHAVHPVAQSPEAFEPTERPFDHIALPLQHGVLAVQLSNGLLSWDAPPRRDEWPESLIMHKLPEPEAVIALVSEQRWLARLRQVGQNVTQDRQRLEDVGQGQVPERSVVIVAGGHADGERSPYPIDQE
jgi:hypothetical protein